MALGGGGAAVAADGAGAEVESSLVEDFAYPGADAILAEHGLKLIAGDGHILFEPSEDGWCDAALIKVEKHIITGTVRKVVNYCFETSGTRGFLTLEVPETAAVRGGDEPLEATALLQSGEEKTYDVPANRTVGLDVDPANARAPKSILLELRFGTWETSAE
ncbi:hypothetical protein [Cellulomonas cellasea]|uniref:hypothetical protein n=1 Tax=Cellulomonas cellasea TaxID=43670 RepID=UPI00114433C2|nr:hypothetical protein [Cellulomonas cellasea]